MRRTTVSAAAACCDNRWRQQHRALVSGTDSNNMAKKKKKKAPPLSLSRLLEVASATIVGRREPTQQEALAAALEDVDMGMPEAWALLADAARRGAVCAEARTHRLTDTRTRTRPHFHCWLAGSGNGSRRRSNTWQARGRRAAAGCTSSRSASGARAEHACYFTCLFDPRRGGKPAHNAMTCARVQHTRLKGAHAGGSRDSGRN